MDLTETISSTLAIGDFLLDSLDFSAEVVIVRDKNRPPQPTTALAPDREMDWNRWWEQVHELLRLNAPIIRNFDAILRTATTKVQRLQVEKELKTQNN